MENDDMMMKSKPMLIDKERIADLHFPQHEVLRDKDAMTQRTRELKRATTLGNVEHGKIKIIFEDNEGVKLVETTIWGVTDNRIILKKGIVIPIHRIHDVKV